MNWLPFAPNGENQTLKEQTNSCIPHASVHGAESEEFKITGILPDYSERWVALIGKVDPLKGGRIDSIFEAIATIGLVKESSWPHTPDMTRDEYYAPPNPQKMQELLAEGKEWLSKWQVIPKYNVDLSALEDAPLQTIVWYDEAHTILHCVELLNPDTIFDSLPHSSDPTKEWIQPLSIYHGIESNHQLIIKQKNMTNSILVKKQQPDGTFEYGFFDPATKPDGLDSMFLNRGLTFPRLPDTTPDWNAIEGMCLGIVQPK